MENKWWYREPVKMVARDYRAILTDVRVFHEGLLLLHDRNNAHLLIAFLDLGLNNPVWLPQFHADGANCVAYLKVCDDPEIFQFAISPWLDHMRPALSGHTLQMYRPPPKPRPTRRDKIFNPKKRRPVKPSQPKLL